MSAPRQQIGRELIPISAVQLQWSQRTCPELAVSNTPGVPLLAGFCSWIRRVDFGSDIRRDQTEMTSNIDLWSIVRCWETCGVQALVETKFSVPLITTVTPRHLAAEWAAKIVHCPGQNHVVIAEKIKLTKWLTLSALFYANWARLVLK